MSELLAKCLTDLQERIDEDQERANYDNWLAFLNDRCEDDIFIPATRKPAPPKVNWPDVSVNQAIEDVEAMLLHQFGMCSDVLTRGAGHRLNVRCNYGTGILPTLFGCDLFMMDEQTAVLPAARSLGSADKVRALLDAGQPDIKGGLGDKVFEAAERFRQILREYPVLGRNVALYHPDVQGPIDVAEVIWGSEIFYAFYDDTELLKDFLGLITETYIAFMRHWYDLVGKPREYSMHWNLMYQGTLMIRNDSLMNLSPATYVEFIRPLDQRLFDEFGGGAIHFCGRGDHFIEAMSEMRGLTAINMSQPELNDMEIIYRNTIDKGIKLIGFDWEAAKSSGRPLRGQVQCFPPKEDAR